MSQLGVNPATLKRVVDDPEAFINSINSGVIIDEVQKFPDLLSYIQISVDEDYQPGRFVITGSQNLLLSQNISQSLAGRVAVLTLLPLTLAELDSENYLHEDMLDVILGGFYPGRYDKKIDKSLFYGTYIETYIERDVRQLANIGDLTNFRRFLSVLAGRVGQILNSSSIANDIGVTHKTIQAWISILEASYIVFRLPPYFKNHGKRLIKSPKIFFHDVGLVSYLLELDSISELKNHYALGSLFKNMIVSDLLKSKHNSRSSSNLYFWRDRKGQEVDLVISTGTLALLVEIKAGATYSTDFIRNLEFYKKVSQEKTRGYVIYNGSSSNPIKGNEILNWKELERITKKL